MNRLEAFFLYFLRPLLSVAVKDIKITVRYPTWFVASFFWPVIFPLTFVFVGRGLAGTTGQGLESFRGYAGTGDYASYIILGNLIWMFVNINLWMGGMALQQDRGRGTFDTHWTMPTAKAALVLGSTIASILLNFVPMAVSILAYAAMGIFSLSGNFFSIMVATIMVMPFLIGFLFAFAAVTVRLRQAFVVVMITRSLLSILCGLQFPLAVLPESISGIGRWIPLTHFVDLVRGVVIAGAPLSAYSGSILYLLVTGLGMFLFGIGFFELMKRSVRRRGLTTGY